MKSTLAFFLLACLPSLCWCQEDNDFRKVKWGMSIAQVKSTETSLKPVQETHDAVLYKTQAAGFDVELLYNFDDGKLISARYFFDEKHTNQNIFFSDFSSVVKIIASKYGEPDTNEERWSNELYKDDPSRKGFALSLGHVFKGATWNFPRTKIQVLLGGDNYKILMSVGFDSKELASLKDQKNNEKAKSDF